MTTTRRSAVQRALPRLFQPHDLPATWPFRRIDYRLGDTPIVQLHRHDVLELGFCRAGSGTYLVEDKVFRFAAGDALVIGPRELHWSQSDPGTASQWTYLFADPPRLLGGIPDAESSLTVASLAGPAFPNVLAAAGHPRAVALIGLLADAAAGTTAQARCQVRGLLLTVLAELHRLPGREAAPARPDGCERLAPALRLIGERFRDDLGVAALARACAMGETTFRRAFGEAFGHGPKEHLIRLRLAHAAARLHAGASVTDAALDAGFATLSTFHRHFRARYGTAPQRLRAG